MSRLNVLTRNEPGVRRRAGLTLVELLVAIALSAILIGVITFIWVQSNRIFTVTVNQLEAYQRLRTVLDIMERDLANTNRTVDMEFFADGTPDPLNGDPNPPNGHYDEGESLLSVNGLAANGADDGQPRATDVAPAFRAPRDPLDPLFGATEFNEDDDPSNAGLSNAPFFYSPFLFSPPPYQISDSDYTSNRHYWRDEIYVRTYALAGGLVRPAMVHYRLVQNPDTGRSALRRRTWFLNNDGKIIAPPPNDTSYSRALATDTTTILVDNIADLKFGFYFKESTIQGAGRWFQVGFGPSNASVMEADSASAANGQSLFQTDAQRHFLNARQAFGSGVFADMFSDQFNTGGSPNIFGFFYQGNARIEEPVFGPVLLRTLNGNVNDPLDAMPAPEHPGSEDPLDENLTSSSLSNLDHYQNFPFPGVRPGDKVFVFDAIDDDTETTSGNPYQAAGEFFPDQVLTVDQIITDASRAYVGIRFAEPLNFFRLRKTWLGEENRWALRDNQVDPTTGDSLFLEDLDSSYPRIGPARDIVSSFNCRYRIGFLPAAFYVRLSIDDAYNRRIIPVERVIRLLQQ